MSTLFAQWTHLFRLILKRDRWFLPSWIIGVLLFCISFVPAMPSIAGTAEELAVLGEMMKNPALIAMCGILYGEETTLAIIYTQMMFVFSTIFAIVMNILIVIRHTRTDEDEGRLEVIRALPTGRLANLTAVAVLVVGINLILAVLTGFGMAAFGVETFTLAGCLVYAAALGACGLLFAAITMVVVQFVQTSRSAIGVSMVLLGGAYVLRAYGDVRSETAAQISPLGLIQRTYPFYENQWWPVVVLVLIGVVLIVVSIALNSLRDLGLGLLPTLGLRRAHAPRTLSGEWGLSWRLTRGTILACAVTIFILSAGYGSVMGDMEGFIMSNPLYQNMMGIGADTVDIVGPVVTMLIIIMAIVGIVPVLTTAYKLSSEENKGRLDYVLGKSVSRYRLYAGYAILVVIVSAVMMALTALGFWVAAAYVMDEPVGMELIAKVAFNFYPSMFVMGGLGLFLVGWAKRFTWIGWAYAVFAFLLTYIGGMMDLPRWVQRLAPFGLLQRYPTEPFSWWPWLGLMVAGIILGLLGAVGFRRRDA